MAKRTALQIVEDIVRNMPITGIRYRYCETPHGKVYTALGKVEAENRYMGVWAFTEGPGICQDVEFRKNQRAKDCWALLEQTGVTILEEFAKRGLLAEGVFSGR